MLLYIVNSNFEFLKIYTNYFKTVCKNIFMINNESISLEVETLTETNKIYKYGF